jgi:hypothetical protein
MAATLSSLIAAGCSALGSTTVAIGLGLRLALSGRDRQYNRPPKGANAMNRLDGKVAFISGAARGIGAATARLMVEAGAKVAIGDVLDERGRETTRSIAGATDAALFQHLDVTSEGDWTAAIAATVARFGGLDILVNNAGLFLGKGIE